jgi:hypothetical protein
MHQAMDSIAVLNFVQVFFEHTADKNITGKQRFKHPHHATLRRPLDSQLRLEHFQIQILAQVRRRQMLMFGLCPRTIPSWISGLHFFKKLDPNENSGYLMR